MCITIYISVHIYPNTISYKSIYVNILFGNLIVKSIFPFIGQTHNNIKKHFRNAQLHLIKSDSCNNTSNESDSHDSKNFTAISNEALLIQEFALFSRLQVFFFLFISNGKVARV